MLAAGCSQQPAGTGCGPAAAVHALAGTGARAPVAASRDGRAVVAWESSVGGPVMAAVRAPDGAWSPSHTLSGRGAAAPRVAMSPQGAVAVWDAPGPDGRSRVEVAGERDGTWAPATALGTPEGSSPLKPRIAAGADGTVAVAWRTRRGLGVAVRTPGGTWSEDSVPGAHSVFELDVAVGRGGLVAVTWSATVASGRPLLTALRRPGGEWTAPEDLSARADVVSAPRIAAVGAGFAAVWTVRPDEDHEIVRAATTRGDAWGSAVTLAPVAPRALGLPRPPGPPTTGPSLAADGDAAVAAWSQGQGGGQQTAMVSRHAGGAWSAPRPVGDAPSSGWPAVADGGVVAFEELRGSALRVAVGRDGTSTCCAVASPPRVEASAPSAAPVADGTLVAWQNSNTGGVAASVARGCG